MYSNVPGIKYRYEISKDALGLAAGFLSSLTETQQIILFTAAMSNEGVSTICSQIALALARLQKEPVLLMDANFRAPSLHDLFGVRQIPGLSDLILKRAVLKDVEYSINSSAVTFLPAGSVPDDPLSLLSSQVLSGFMKELRRGYRYIVIDSSPLIGYIDSTILASHADGVVITTAAGKRRQSELLEAKRLLDVANSNIIGVLLSFL